MRSIAYFFLSPVNWVILLAVLGLILRFKKKKKWGNGLLIGAGVVSLLFSMGPIPYYLTANLEAKYKPLKDISALHAPGLPIEILVLGGGHSPDTALTANNQLSTPSLGRLVEALRLHRQLPGSHFVFTGRVSTKRESIAEGVRRAAILMGADSNNITIIIEPRNTLEEAKAYAKLRGEQNRLILVTDAMHMPRAMRCLELQGLTPLAAPANPNIKLLPGQARFRWIPSIYTLLGCFEPIKEYAGLFKLTIEN